MSSATKSVAQPTRPWASRVDSWMLRLQARLDTERADRIIPWVFTLVLASVLEWLVLLRYWGLGHGLELATAIQSSWLIEEGYIPESTLLGENYLAMEAGYILYPVTLVTWVFPLAQTLLTLQSLALALGIVPLWRLSRDEAYLGLGASTALVFAYSVSASVHNLNLAGFHTESLSLPALLGVVLFTRLGRRPPGTQLTHSLASTPVHYSRWRRWWRQTPLEVSELSRKDMIWLWSLVAVVLLSRSDLGLVIGAFGILVVVEGRKRLGWWLVGVGFGWLVVAIGIIQPLLADGNYVYLEDFTQYGTRNPFSLIWGIITQPGQFLSDVFAQSNYAGLVALLAPLVFLPLLAYRYFLPAVPLYIFYLLADVPDDPISESSQTIPVVAFVFVSAVFALNRTGQVLVERVRLNRQVILALVLAAAVFFVRDAATSPYGSPWGRNPSETYEESRLAAVEQVPKDAVVRASVTFLPRLAERVGIYELDTSGAQARDDAIDAMNGVNWILLDVEEAPEWGGQSLEVQRFATVLRQSGWEQTYEQDGTYVFRYLGS